MTNLTIRIVCYAVLVGIAIGINERWALPFWGRLVVAFVAGGLAVMVGIWLTWRHLR